MTRWLTLAFLLSLAPASFAQQFDGVLQWANTAVLSSPLNGKVTSVKVAEGDRVLKGDLLATLDPRLFQAKVKRAKAALKGLSSRFEELDREYVRAQDLFDRTVLSQTDLQNVEVRYYEAEAAKGEAEAELALARIQLEYTQLRAPFDGIITERKVNPQEVVSNRFQVSPMITMSATEQLKATFWVTPQASATVKRGNTVQITVEGQQYDGKVLHVGLNSKREHQQVLTSVAVSIQQQGDALNAGRPAHINLP